MQTKSGLSRRDFIKTTLQAPAGIAALSGITIITQPERVFGANDRVRVAVCGLRSRGQDHIEGFSTQPHSEVAALCDIDDNVMAKRLADIAKTGGPKPITYFDVRKALDDKSIDAVSIATPNHWHSLIAIWACQAGKDVYVEKPCSHNLWEGQQLVRAAQTYNRIVQHGTQARSAPGTIEGIQKLRDGEIGELYLARGLCYKWRNTIGHAPVEPVPAGVHYDLWTGPAPLHAFTTNRFHYKWHWFWWYGNGDLGNQGIHQVDVARWALGVGFPNKISAIGGHFMFDDDQETPNTLNCAFEFDQPGGRRKMIEFEVRHWITNHEAELGTEAFGERSRPGHPQLTVGNIIYGSKGIMAIGEEDTGIYKTWLGQGLESGPSANSPGNHFANFIECVRSRKKEDLHAPIEEGHISCAMVHLANVSYRLGRTLYFNPETQEVIGDEEAAILLRDGMRGYRAPFVVPEEV